jgi:flagellar motor switch protein FliM
VPIMECKYGVSNGQYALRVEKMLSTTPNDGGNHA